MASLESSAKTMPAEAGWPALRVAIAEGSGPWGAFCSAAALARGWRCNWAGDWQDLMALTRPAAPVLAVAAWTPAWQVADWGHLAQLCRLCPTVVVGNQPLLEWELLLRQFGALDVFSVTLQRPRLLRLMDRLSHTWSPGEHSLEEIVQFDLDWGNSRF